MIQLLTFLAVTRIAKAMDEIKDVRQKPVNLLWTPRVARAVDALDGDIMARFDGVVYAADMITDDTKAVVRDSSPIRLQQTKIPSFKHGVAVKQEMLNMLLRLSEGAALKSELSSWDGYMVNELNNLIKGVETRIEAVAGAMVADDLTYDRLGVKINGLSWGLPADLKKVLAGNARWLAANKATMTPIKTVQDLLKVSRDKYGIVYNRITMAGEVFDDVVASDEFKEKAQFYYQANGIMNAAGMPTDSDAQKSILGRLLKCDVEIDDRQFAEQDEQGNKVFTRYQPVANVVLSVKEFDGDTSVYDFANGVTTESVVGRYGGVIGSFESGPQRGPIGYATAPSDLNPPQVTLWAVQRGFVRKHVETATAVIKCR
jgi:hypothetical protein